ncbi:uncharacterized protein LOC126549748 [Aphis gossypii]|uniref:uncharacterized protein LOC126549748 n=1 Tax=Aphis gossypii TaxID=80765 RepID=UPI0021591495|nr:uncharacterized protein LOC126549748 [Aphis gossypii]
MESEFLTKQTADGLLVTMKSTIELAKYLLQSGFPYVLSNKMIQDRLEQFFGMVCQASGPNDHPSSLTFIHIYKILSSYSILKPPKSGNCTILETSSPKITSSEIKQIVDTDSSEREAKIRNLFLFFILQPHKKQLLQI